MTRSEIIYLLVNCSIFVITPDCIYYKPGTNLSFFSPSLPFSLPLFPLPSMQVTFYISLMCAQTCCKAASLSLLKFVSHKVPPLTPPFSPSCSLILISPFLFLVLSSWNRLQRHTTPHDSPGSQEEGHHQRAQESPVD